MDAATIMVLVLCAGGAALLVWFEISSRRNEATKKQTATPSQSTFEPLPKEAQTKAESEIEKTKAA
jgi:hypothetical protein